MSIQVITRSKSRPSLGRQFTMTAGFMDTFVDSLAKPDEPKHCARYYISCMHIFNIEPSVYAEFRCVRPDIFAAILRFLTIRRPDSAIPSLEERLSTCRCAETDENQSLKSTHILDAPPTGKAFPHLMERAASFMTLSFIHTGPDAYVTELPSLDKTRKEAKKADKRGERFPWPKQPRDVFVNPPEMMLQTLWKLYHTYEEPTVIIFIQLLMLAAGTTFTSVIYTIPDFPLQFTYHFERVLAQNTDSSRITFSMLLHILLYATNRFFEGDMHMVNAWQPYATEMVSAVSKALYIFDALPGPKVSADPQNPTQMQLLSRCGHILIQISRGDSEVQANLRRYHPMIITETRLFETKLPHEDLIVAYDKIYRLVTSDRCHAPGCFETFSKQSRRFQACSGCKVVSYCSKECQTSAWKHPDIPHKPFCAALVSYTKKIGVDWRKTAIKPQLDPTGVAKMCLEGGVTREESTAILNFDLELINWNSWFKTMGEVNGPEFRRIMATKRHV